ncbi:MAG: hypothetical protein SFU86_01060 [Pirellulaceae bacterium]|nr:hypothetical protein [Pirellulaceae bacterium]
MNDNPPIDVDDLNRPNDYTGVFEAFWPNGQLKYRRHFVNGVEVGQHIRFWEDGMLAHISWRDPAGHMRGTMLTFYPGGDKDTEEIWSDDERRPGTFEKCCYNANGDIFLKTSYLEFEQIDLWERPKSDAEQQQWESLGIDKMIADSIKKLTELTERNDDEDDF